MTNLNRLLDKPITQAKTKPEETSWLSDHSGEIAATAALAAAAVSVLILRGRGSKVAGEAFEAAGKQPAATTRVAEKSIEVALKKMTGEDYRAWLPASINSYAKSAESVGTWSPIHSRTLAEDAFKKLLPAGKDTPSQHFYSVTERSSGANMGSMWFSTKEHPNSVFLYDFSVKSEFRNKGIGFQALQHLETESRKLSANQIGLHVFANNQPAIALYRKFGFKPTEQTHQSILMNKVLD